MNETLNVPRIFGWTGVAIAALVWALAGCSCPTTAQDVRNLRKAIEDERKAVQPRKGFEASIAAERAGVDKKLDALEATHK